MVEAMNEYRPRWAPWVVGTFQEPEFDPTRGCYEPLRVDVRCEKCGEATRRTCDSGQPRDHVARFARLHVHRDPLGPVPFKAPGT
jgi:hypothetical protein